MDKKGRELDRASIIDDNFIQALKKQIFPKPRSFTSPEDANLSAHDCLEILRSQIISRHLDSIARQLREKNQAFYTIGSSGHEGNAAIAKAFQLKDMAFLHYRSGAFVIERSNQNAESANTIIRDQLLSLVSSKEDPIAGGRHKVFGSKALNIPPQTSTIASHLPKALGTAFSINLAKELQLNTPLAKDSVVICSFGDASANHSTALGAFNAGSWIVAHHLPLPIVWICEDNGWGISVKTPENWVENNFKTKPFLEYMACDGLNFCDVYLASAKAAHFARTQKKPVFLHFKTVRLLGHAGSDIETQYQTIDEIEKNEQEDPLLHSARILIENKIIDAQGILDLYENIREEVTRESIAVLQAAKLSSASEIMECLIPEKQIAVKNAINKTGDDIYRLHNNEQKKSWLTLAKSINLVLSETLSLYPNTVIFGEDVGKKGGVYHITADLQSKFGRRRVFDTLLDEQTILGLSIGLSLNGFIPIPEIQFLAFLNNAADMIRGEAATLSFFSRGQFTNPMVIRVPGLAYQKGFGGHFHNDNAFAFLREIPGIIIACPSNAHDAVKMFRECFRLANEERRIVIFLEPIALYHVKDLHQKGDNAWLGTYPNMDEKTNKDEGINENEGKMQTVPFGESALFGEPAIYGEGKDCVILTFGNGYYLSRQAETILKNDHHIHITVVDLRWLVPLNRLAILKTIAPFTKILIVDEERDRGSVSEELMTMIVENVDPPKLIQRITGKNCFIPLGEAAQFVLPSLQEIVEKVCQMQK